jgi:hypothetical protein
MEPEKIDKFKITQQPDGEIRLTFRPNHEKKEYFFIFEKRDAFAVAMKILEYLSFHAK